MTIPRPLLGGLVAFAAGVTLVPCVALAQTPPPTTRPSLVDVGDTARLAALFAKAERGEPITVGCFGGSITQGYAASTPDKNYASLVAAWWQRTFPKSKVTLVNAGIGGTGSDYGGLRAQADLFSKHPDFVIVEFSVNDDNNRAYADTYEGLVRQILVQPNSPACLLLFMTQENHTSAQAFDEQIGRHYRLPMASYRDGIFAKLNAGEFKWRDISPDNIHPNDRGMAFAAQFVIEVLEAARNTPATMPVSAALPAPLFTDLYAHTALARGDELKPTRNDGWTFDEREKGWTSSTPGSVIEFRQSGRAITLIFTRVHGDWGKAKVTVDDAPPLTLDGWFDQTWGAKKELVQIVHDLDATKPHAVRIELLNDTSPASHGHRFRILGLGAAGVDATK